MYISGAVSRNILMPLIIFIVEKRTVTMVIEEIKLVLVIRPRCVVNLSSFVDFIDFFLERPCSVNVSGYMNLQRGFDLCFGLPD